MVTSFDEVEKKNPREGLTFGFVSDTLDLMEERVEVMVKFGGGKIRPMWFVWRGRDFRVCGWPMSWERKDGGKRLLCFSVDTGGMMAELAFDREELSWKIMGTAA